MIIFHKRLSFQLALLGLLLCAVSAQAQEAIQPEIKDRRSTKVALNVIVTDNSNQAVTDLQHKEVRVLEDGKQQAITHFALEELPVSYGILVDASGSMRTLISHIIDSAKEIIMSNKPEDETFIMRFVDTDTIEVEQGFTSNKDALTGVLDGIYVEGGQTAVIDAINRAIEYHRKNRRVGDEDQRRRHALVLISDGEDRGSVARNADAIMARLREDDIQFFIIGLTNLATLKGTPQKAMSFLTRLAELSGGRAFFPKSPADLPNIVEEIKRDLHKQYVIGYSPTNVRLDGSFRKVQVSVPDSQSRKKLNIITRPGYVAR